MSSAEATGGVVPGSAYKQPSVMISPPLFKLMMLDALKNNSYSQLRKIMDSSESASNHNDLLQMKSLVLNLAVQVASIKMIQKLLTSQGSKELDVNINYQDSDGNTPLHLAALNNRLDVAQLLLRDSRINDTLLNKNMKQPIDLTKDLNMIEMLQYERGQYIEKVALEFRKAFTDHDFAALEDILAQPRNFELLDINGNDPESGDTVLHEFVKVNDIAMVQWILGHGGDPFKRDRKGRLPVDLVSKNNEAMKQILRDATKQQSVINMSKVGGLTAPTFKGYLSKWTNFAGGYKLRWFVLDQNGILSYYKSQDDTSSACRGSLNMRNAMLHLDSSEKMKFEIIGKTGVSWHLKGNHPTETNRWVWALQGAIRFAKDKEAERIRFSEVDGMTSAEITSRMMEQTSSPLISSSGGTFTYDRGFNSSINHHEKKKKERKSSTTTEILNYSDDDDGSDSEEEEYINDIQHAAGPFAQDISMAKSGFKIQLDALKDLLHNMQINGSSQEAVVISLTAVSSMIESFDELIGLVNKRDEKIVKSLVKQRDMNELWINSMRDLENELIAKNSELETFESERRKIKKALTKKLNYSATNLERTNSGTDPSEAPNISEPVTTVADEEISKILQDSEDSDDEFFDADNFSDREDGYSSNDILSQLHDYKGEEAGKPDETIIIEEQLLEILTESQKKRQQMLIQECSFHGYEDPLRTELGLKVDERPAVSLWGILKSMIGKDITKITLPVAFNEPTSMLQRIAEDFEYSSLLEQAASFDDSSLRMLYVAVFNMSQYSSTIDRVAKPFNPLLGETFEYSRPDLGFRFFTEQVSHHPPISAMMAEHPKWDYYGETSVKSAFNGRSFDVQPTATWYLHLRPDNAEEEIYSWKKLTTSVVGIIVGSPSIDNYGDMVITNNKTGDQCTITFKPRGWRSSQAYEMSGLVTDKNGTKKWAIGGHWNSKVYAKKIVSNDTVVDVSSKKNVALGPTDNGSKFLMWSARPRPTVPFNLTSYAISLNAPQPSLLPWLAASDTRLRPDQRAMEDGLYDNASDLKSYLEEKQRSARKKREEEGLPYAPKFFAKEIHPITGEEYWRYNGDYWKLRSQKTLPDIDIF